MRSLIFIALSSSIALSAPTSDRIEGTELETRRQKESPMSALTSQPDSTIAVKRLTQQGLIKQSLIISDGSNWTLLPKGAVLHLPADFEGRVGGRPVGNLLSWREFSIRNRAWIGAEEISMKQAEGNEMIDPRRTTYWPKQSKVIIAVHRGGPISVIAPTTGNETASTR